VLIRIGPRRAAGCGGRLNVRGEPMPGDSKETSACRGVPRRRVLRVIDQ